MDDYDLDLPGLGEEAPRRTPASRLKPKEVSRMQSTLYVSPSENPWNAFVTDEAKPVEMSRSRTVALPEPARSRTAAGPAGSGFNYSKPLDVWSMQDDFAYLMKGAGQDVAFETQKDIEMEKQARDEIERWKREDQKQERDAADEILDLLGEEPKARPRTSDAPSVSDAKRSGDSTPSRTVPTAKFESEIGTLEIGASRRRPRTQGVVRSTAGDPRPNSAPQDTGKTLLKAKTTSFEARDSPPNRPSITKQLGGGEITEIPEGDPTSEDSSRPTDLNDRATASRGRTVEFTEPPLQPVEDKLEINRRIAHAVNEERERLKSSHERDVEARETKYRDQLEAQKRLFESQIASLEAVIKHQESLASLSTAISGNSDTLNTLLAKFQNDKSFDDQLKLQEFAAKQKALSQLEQRLLAQQQVMELDKQHMLEVMKRMQDEDLIKNSVLEQEREGLRKDREELHKFQEFLRDQDRMRKEEHLLEKQKITMQRESLLREHNMRMQEVAEQASDLKIKQTLFDQQRAEFEQEELANRSMLQQKFAQLESVRGQVTEMESRAARKLMDAEERERAAASEWEKVQRGLSTLQADKAQLEEEAQKLHQVSLAVQAKSMEIAQMREDLDKEREDILRMRQEAEMKIGVARSEANRVEAQHRELAVSMKSYEQLRFGLVKEMHSESRPLTRESLTPIQEMQQRLAELSQLKRTPTPMMRKPTFTASEFLKDLQNYDRARGEFQSYVTTENQQLLKTKLEMETGFSESLVASGPTLRWKASASGSERSMKDLTQSALNG